VFHSLARLPSDVEYIEKERAHVNTSTWLMVQSRLCVVFPISTEVFSGRSFERVCDGHNVSDEWSVDIIPLSDPTPNNSRFIYRSAVSTRFNMKLPRALRSCKK
jgi:hypothetical protein